MMLDCDDDKAYALADEEKTKQPNTKLKSKFMAVVLFFAVLGFEQLRREAVTLFTFQQRKTRKSAGLSSIQTEKKKPTFVFYVGLPKTATSFIQCTLCSNLSETKPILLLDDYEYIGTCPYRTCGLTKMPKEVLKHRFYDFFSNLRGAEGMGPKLHQRNSTETFTSRGPPTLAPQFTNKVQGVYDRGHNAFVVYEGAHGFPDRYIQAMAAYLEPTWNVQLVTGYRPLYEWLPSKYNSVYKGMVSSSWPGMVKGGRAQSGAVPPFDVDNRGTFSSMVNDIEHVYHKHPAEIVRDNYQLHFSHHHTLMEQHRLPPPSGRGDAILEDLFCRMIPDAPHICQEVIHGALEFPAARNPSVSLDEDALAVAAYEAGRLPPVTPRKGHPSKVRQAITLYFQQLQQRDGGYEFPLECFSTEKLHRLEQLSQELEEQLFRGDTYSEEDVQRHHEGFLKAVAKKKYCHVDTSAVLQQPEWQEFFASDELRKALQER